VVVPHVVVAALGHARRGGPSRTWSLTSGHPVPAGEPVELGGTGLARLQAGTAVRMYQRGE
jgi:hypothetical protein